MIDGAPDTPAGRIRNLIELMETPEWREDEMVMWAILGELEDVAQGLAAHEGNTAAPTIALCAKRGPGTRWTACDRQAGHKKGECSWQIARSRAMVAEYETHAAEVPKMRQAMMRLQAALTKAEHEVAAERLRATAFRSRRARRAAAERG